MSAARKAAAEKPSFEVRLAQLEALVEDLESGEWSLEDGVDKYRQGVELLRTLQTSLASAELKVQKLTEELRQELAALEEEEPGLAEDGEPH
ncbi:MAG: exodeoxyribonuclease VII small subunit [Planctomycetota bacterium]|nr:MAG: exodeoxyribonuclease VII small subunit [Planctomycetota bacterium]